MSGSTSGAGVTGTRVDPFRNYNFRVDIGDPGGDLFFTECLGLAARVHTIRFREAGSPVVRALPGAVEYADVTLRHGLTTSMAVWNWLSGTIAGDPAARRNVSIIVLQPDGQTEGLRWNLINAFPSEWSGASFDAMGREAAIVQLRLSFDEFRRG